MLEIWQLTSGCSVLNTSMNWTRSGEQFSAITIREFGLGLDGTGILRISFSKNSGPTVEQTIRLVSTSPHYGGERWWFACPWTGKKCLHLYLALRSDAFVSRKGLGLKYQSQKENTWHRAMRRYQVKADRYGAEWGEPWFPKPKGMHLKTYQRRMSELEFLNDRVDGHFLSWGLKHCGITASTTDEMIKQLDQLVFT
jgi:hypothetical protein